MNCALASKPDRRSGQSLWHTLLRRQCVSGRLVIRARQQVEAAQELGVVAITMVERLIRTAPTAGGRSDPTGASAPAASGMAIRLYPIAQARFSLKSTTGTERARLT